LNGAELRVRERDRVRVIVLSSRVVRDPGRRGRSEIGGEYRYRACCGAGGIGLDASSQLLCRRPPAGLRCRPPGCGVRLNRYYIQPGFRGSRPWRWEGAQSQCLGNKCRRESMGSLSGGFTRSKSPRRWRDRRGKSSLRPERAAFLRPGPEVEGFGGRGLFGLRVNGSFCRWLRCRPRAAPEPSGSVRRMPLHGFGLLSIE